MINIQFSMKKIAVVFFVSLLTFNFFGQTVNQKLQKAFTAFEQDSQLKHAISSLYIIDANTGQVVFDKNSQIGLAPASTQKIITSVTAFELLGKDYMYKTEVVHDGSIQNGTLKGNIYVIGSGDPTFGSWRYTSTKEQEVFNRIAEAIVEKGIKGIDGDISIRSSMWHSQTIPGGWVWQDIGNYYGAGASGFNWRENQYDLILQSGNKIGDPVVIRKTIPGLWYKAPFISEVKSAAKNSGDNAYIYLPENSSQQYVRGTIPVGENEFVISGTMTKPNDQFANSLRSKVTEKILMPDFSPSPNTPEWNGETMDSIKKIYTYYSPSLDSVIYWFLKKSINLYGEALVKTFAYEKQGFGSTDSGVNIVKKFWKGKGIDEDELNIYDGSGLSPLNRVTTHAQVEVLKYAKTKDWFPYFYDALPEFNGMKMKSGTISDVKGFCGYHKAKNGKEYIFSFLVNNYNGSSSLLINKMYKVLDILK